MSNQAAVGKVTADAAQGSVYLSPCKPWLTLFQRSPYQTRHLQSFARNCPNHFLFRFTEVYLGWWVELLFVLEVGLTLLVVGNATYAAITAVFSAHLVLVAYISMSIMEDKKMVVNSPVDSKKDR